jgi:hypothetical protein
LETAGPHGDSKREYGLSSRQNLKSRARIVREPERTRQDAFVTGSTTGQVGAILPLAGERIRDRCSSGKVSGEVERLIGYIWVGTCGFVAAGVRR